MWLNVSHAIGASANDNDRKLPARQILLLRKILIERYENIETLVSKREQFAICLSGPAGFGNRFAAETSLG